MKYRIILSLILALNFHFLFAIKIDNDFQKPLPRRTSQVNCIKNTPDGKLLIGGDIKYYKNKRCNNLICVNKDGRLNPDFNFTKQENFIVDDIELLSNGDIIILSKWSKLGIIKLSPKGDILQEISTNNVYTIAVQEDDKILVGGMSSSGEFLYRLNSDLTPDNEFNQLVTFDGSVSEVSVYKNKIYVSGSFTLVNGITKHNIVRLNLDGTVDDSFDTGSGPNTLIRSLTFQEDDKILLGGTYIKEYNGIKANGIARINSDGSLDQNFQPPESFGPNSKIYCNGSSLYLATTIYNSWKLQDCILKLNLDGTIDTSFKTIKIDGWGSLNSVITLINDDLFVHHPGINYGIGKYNLDGNLITEFSPKLLRYGTFTCGAVINEKLIVGGDFIEINGVETFNIAKLNVDGTVDQSFILSEDKGKVGQIEVIDEDNIMILASTLFKSDKNANIKSDFNFIPFDNLLMISKFKVTNNGKIIATVANTIKRLNPDGSKDDTFDVGTGMDPSSTAYDFDFHQDKIIFGSILLKFNNTDVNRLVRINPDGSLDTSFDIGSGPDGPDPRISFVHVLKNNKILVGGEFTSFNGLSTPNQIILLNSDGQIDTEFMSNLNSETIEPFYPHKEKVTEFGTKIFIQHSGDVIALNDDGTLDKDFILPFKISNISDFILTNPNPQDNSGSLTSKDSTFFVLGTFMEPESQDPSFVIKLSMADEDEDENPSTISGIEDENMKINFFPNPFEDVVHITGLKTSSVQDITIHNINGRIIRKIPFREAVGKNSLDINLDFLNPGLHFLIVNTNEGTFTKKIAKR